MNRFPPNLGCGYFSSCFTDTWYPKCCNATQGFFFFFCDAIASVLYRILTHLVLSKSTYQYGVPTNELAGLTKDAEPKSAAKRNKKYIIFTHSVSNKDIKV